MKVRVLPDQLELEAKEGENLLEVFRRAGVIIDASCGGLGLCGQCRVKIEAGEVDAEQGVVQTKEEFEEGFRQACLSRIKTDVVVFIPEDSRVETKLVFEERKIPSGQYLTDAEISALNPDWKRAPAVNKLYVELTPPTREDKLNDLQRLLRALRQKYNLRQVSIDMPALRRLPEAMREENFRVTATVVNIRVEQDSDEDLQRGPRKPKLIHIEPGDKRGSDYSLALDIGTTTISGQILDLNRFQAVATANCFNRQVQYGADVITRIIYATNPQGLEKLQKAVVSSINELIERLTERTGLSPYQFTHITASGNTTMTHLLLGLNPKWIRLSPYIPVAHIFPPVRAQELGIKVGEWVHIYMLPCVASYVGGDIVAGILGSGVYKRESLTLYIDIGTNGEIVIGNKDWLLCASCSAGPAFEGGGIKYGMHAAAGAIERFSIDPKDCSVRYQTIGHKPPVGICGSGIINIVAELFRLGLIDQNGKINPDTGSSIIREGENGFEVVIVPKEASVLKEDIVLSDIDLNNLLRAKAAMYAGYQTLLKEVGLEFEDLDEVLIAGNFGNYLDIENAITIGLLPDIARNKFRFIGNGSLLGAKLVSFSNELLDDAERISKMMTNVELADNMTFMDNYMAALFLPHTKAQLFPTVMGKIEERIKNKPPCVPMLG